MRQVLLVRFGEVHLKGQNRPYFLHKLTDNVKKAVAPLNARVWLSDGRIYVSDFEDIQQAIDRVTRVFGLYSVSPAWELDKDYELIAHKCEEMTRGLKGTFKVMARRSDKHFPMNSQQLNAELGGVILDANPDLRVDVHKPDYYVSVEIRDHAYVYIDEIMAVGGMPMGTGGKAMLLLSGGIDSPVAAYRMAKRGLGLDHIHFASPPYTSERAKLKVKALAQLITPYTGSTNLFVVPYTKPQEYIRDNAPDVLFTVLMRRSMMRIANRIATRQGCEALITGESLAQVASQTVKALQCTDAACAR